MGIIQSELNRVAREWNCHRILASPTADVPGGIPDMLYFVPESQGFEIYRKPVEDADIVAARQHVDPKPPVVPQEFGDIAEHIMAQSHIGTP